MSRATDRFLTEIRRSHTIVSYVDVIAPGQEVRRLQAVDGTVNVDRTAQYRRAASIACIDPTGAFLPSSDNSGILTPFGTECRPYRGVQYVDGTTEVMPLGVFRLAQVTLSEGSSAAGVQIALEMYDRSRTVSRDAFLSVYSIPAGTNIVTAIKLILDRTFSDIEYDAVSTTMTTTAPQVFDAGNDPWEACVTLATSIGCEIYFDVDGRVVIAPPTDLDAMPAPSFTYIAERGMGNTATDMQTVFSDEPGHNGVIVVGESPGDELPPVRAEAWDDNAGSPTYRYGPYGEVPLMVTDSNVKTNAQALAMAESILKGFLGFAAQLSVTASVNPALEAGDVVQVKRDKLNVDALYVVDAFTVPLRKDGQQTLRLRSRRGGSL